MWSRLRILPRPWTVIPWGALEALVHICNGYKRLTLITPFTLLILITLTGGVAGSPPEGRTAHCDQEAKPDVRKIYGKIQFVTSFPDYKVQVVDSFPDLKVQKVESFPNKPGKWQIVDSFPDYKIQLVNSFPDFKIKYVTSFPGTP